MAQIPRFIPRDVQFDPETAAMLGAVFDKAIAVLRHGAQPETVKEAVAKRIITLAAGGERNPGHLCTAALAVVGVPR